MVDDSQEIESYEEPPQNKEELLNRLQEIISAGWVSTRVQENDGLVGNTLEDFLGIEENNIALPDVGEYELKTQRRETQSMTTLTHYDPFPRRPSPVQDLLIPEYGWAHPSKEGEKSFRVTLRGDTWVKRGFRVIVDREEEKVFVEFDKDKVDDSLEDWKKEIPEMEDDERPYWSFEKLRKKVEDKLPNTIYVIATARRDDDDVEEFNYRKIQVWEDFDFDDFLDAVETGEVRIDFDASSYHNHGTKFRVSKGNLDHFYDTVYRITEEKGLSRFIED